MEGANNLIEILKIFWYLNHFNNIDLLSLQLLFNQGALVAVW